MLEELKKLLGMEQDEEKQSNLNPDLSESINQNSDRMSRNMTPEEVELEETAQMIEGQKPLVQEPQPIQRATEVPEDNQERLALQERRQQYEDLIKALSQRSQPKSGEPKEDKERQSARRKDTIMGLLDSLDKSFSRFSAANPNVIVKPVESGIDLTSQFEKDLLGRRQTEAELRRKGMMDQYRQELLDIQKQKLEQKGEMFEKSEQRRLEQQDLTRKKDQLNAARNLLKDDPRFKKTVEQGAEFQTVNELIEQARKGNQVAMASLGTKLARAMGEVGVLTDSDVVRYVKGTSWGRKLLDWYKSGAEGVPSESTIKDIESNLNTIAKKLNKDIDKIYSNADTRLKTVYPELDERTRKGLLGVPIKPEIGKNNQSEFVTLRSPNGQIARVKKDKAQKYIDKGAEIVENN